MERQERSGLSILEYCRRESFSAANFHAWKRRLRTSKSRVIEAEKRDQQGVSRGPASAGGFLQFPVMLKSTIEVRFADGTLVSMPSENLAVLAVALKTLQAAQLEGAPMITAPSALRIFAYALPTDMRKSFDGLHAIVTNEFTMNVLGGDYFVFFNRALIAARF